jgi:predicted amidophosphoribosyltransferase
MIFCANCGNKMQDDALFCPECGTKAETSIEILQTDIPIPAEKPLTPEPPSLIITPVSVIPEVPTQPKQFCRNCGNEVAAGAIACLNCGLPPMKAYNFCPSCGANCHNDAIICIKCGVRLESQETGSQNPRNSETKKTFCRNCGKEVNKDAFACLNCGLPPGRSKNYCPSCGAETHNEAVICIKCGTALEQFALQQREISAAAFVKPESYQSTTNVMAANQTTNVVTVGNQKSVGTAFILAFFFGPLGLIYASPVGGILMFFVAIILFFLIPVIGGFIAWIICLIWAVVAAQNANESALNKAGNIANNLNRR